MIRFEWGCWAWAASAGWHKQAPRHAWTANLIKLWVGWPPSGCGTPMGWGSHLVQKFRLHAQARLDVFTNGRRTWGRGCPSCTSSLHARLVEGAAAPPLSLQRPGAPPTSPRCHAWLLWCCYVLNATSARTLATLRTWHHQARLGTPNDKCYNQQGPWGAVAF